MGTYVHRILQYLHNNYCAFGSEAIYIEQRNTVDLFEYQRTAVCAVVIAYNNVTGIWLAV